MTDINKPGPDCFECVDRIYDKLVPALKGERSGHILMVLTSIVGEILSKPDNPVDAAERFMVGVKMAMKLYEEKPGTH